MGCGKIVCRWSLLKGWLKGGAGSVQNAYVLRMKRGDPIPKYLDSLVSIESFGEILSTIQLRVFIPAKVFGAPFSFPNLKLSIFHIDLRRPLLGVRAHNCFAVLCANSRDYRRTFLRQTGQRLTVTMPTILATLIKSALRCRFKDIGSSPRKLHS